MGMWSVPVVVVQIDSIKSMTRTFSLAMVVSF
jgi:hypothetical protein